MNHHPTHPLIVIEGIDASGKATLTAALAKALGATTLSFPVYESPTGQALRAHLKGNWRASLTDAVDEMTPAEIRTMLHVHGMPLNPLVRQALMTANRCEAQTTILNMLSRGPVILDRYWLSSLAYGEAEGLDPAWLRAVSAPLLQPDLTLILDIPVSEVAKRRPQARDKNETDLGLLARARTVYRRLSVDSPTICLIDAERPAVEVQAAAMFAVRCVLGL